MVSNQWLAIGRVAFGGFATRQNVQWETIDFYGGLRDSARIV
jgi:hypothetical protein